MHLRTRLIAAALLAPAVAAAQPAEPAPAMPSEAPPAAEVEAPAPAPAPAEPTVAQTEPVAAPPTETVAVETVEESADPESHWYDALQVNGFASVAYSYNTNRPADDTNQLRTFDSDDGTINVDVVELVVQKPAAAAGEAGFRVDLVAGSTVPAAEASAGLFRDADGNAQDFDLQQGFVSYIADVGKGLRLDAGKFVTHMGYEVIEGYDGYNDHYSRSLLFGWTIPFTHTGAKVSYPLTPELSGMVMVVNGWDNVKDNNSGKTFGGMLSATIGEQANAYLCYVGGPEQAANNSNWRHVIDAIGVVRPVDGVTLVADAVYGTEKDAVMTGSAQWYGAALYAKWDASSTVSLALRGEGFVDDDGARTGAAQTLFEGTLSPSLKLGSNIVLRGDLRFDRSDVEAFMTDDATSKQQVTIALNALGIL